MELSKTTISRLINSNWSEGPLSPEGENMGKCILIIEAIFGRDIKYDDTDDYRLIMEKYVQPVLEKHLIEISNSKAEAVHNRKIQVGTFMGCKGSEWQSDEWRDRFKNELRNS